MIPPSRRQGGGPPFAAIIAFCVALALLDEPSWGVRVAYAILVAAAAWLVAWLLAAAADALDTWR